MSHSVREFEIKQGWQYIGQETQARIVPGGVVIVYSDPGLVFVAIADGRHYDNNAGSWQDNAPGTGAQTWINQQQQWWNGKMG